MTLEELRKEALELNLKERSVLAQDLLYSLDDLSPNELHAAWESEILRRIDELRSGKVKGVPAEEVFRKAKERLDGDLPSQRTA